MTALRTKIRDVLNDYCYSTRTDIVESAVDAVLAMLQEQEPVATVQADYEETELGYCQFHANTVYGQNLYAAPKPGDGNE